MRIAMLSLLLLFLAHASTQCADSAFVLVGSAGCDCDDKRTPPCTENATKQRVIVAVKVLPTGEMQPQLSESIEASGLPVWLTISNVDGTPRCLFATYADTSHVAAFTLNPVIKLMHVVSSAGVNPVHAEATGNGKTLLVANYHGPDDTTTSEGASATSFQIANDCRLTLANNVPHTGSSIVPSRQGGAHVHSFVPVRGSLAYACDLGMDVIFSYAVAEDGKLTEIHRTYVTQGSGPRHLVQHPSGAYVYVVHEIGQFVSSWQQRENGELNLMQELPLASKEKMEGSKAAEIVILPDGSALYVTNRGMLNTISVFKVLGDGKLEQVQEVPAPAFPRGLQLVSAGDATILLAAGQAYTELVSYLVGDGGRLARTGHILNEHDGLPPHPATLVQVPPVFAPETEVSQS